jgi:fructose-specific component phosphotransferase system IIB-like protein
MAPDRSYIVYEVVNAAAKEAVVGVSDAPDLDAVKGRHASVPPVWIARWDRSGLRYRLVGSGLSRAAAQAAARERARALENGADVVIVAG